MNLVRVKLKNLNEVSEIIHEDIKKDLEEKIKKLYYFENEVISDKKLPTTSATISTISSNNNEITNKKPLRKPGILNIVKKIKLYEDYESEVFTRYRHNEGSNFQNISIICNDNNHNNDDYRNYDSNRDDHTNSDNDSNNNTKNSLENNSKLEIELKKVEGELEIELKKLEIELKKLENEHELEMEKLKNDHEMEMEKLKNEFDLIMKKFEL